MKNKMSFKDKVKAFVSGNYPKEFIRFQNKNYEELPLKEKRKLVYLVSKILKDKIKKLEKEKEFITQTKMPFNSTLKTRNFTIKLLNEIEKEKKKLEKELRMMLHELYEMDGFNEIRKLNEAYGFELYIRMLKEGDLYNTTFSNKKMIRIAKEKLRKLIEYKSKKESISMEHEIIMLATTGYPWAIKKLFEMNKLEELIHLLPGFSPFSKTKEVILRGLEIKLLENTKNLKNDTLFRLALHGSIKAANILESRGEVGVAKVAISSSINHNKVRSKELAEYLDTLRKKTAGKRLEDITRKVETQHGENTPEARMSMEVVGRNTHQKIKKMIENILKS